MLIASERLADFVTAIFIAARTRPDFARETAEHLVAANLKGHDSHGVGMVPNYVDAIANGHLAHDAEAEVLEDRGAILRVDGGFGFGQVVGRQATDLAIERARDTGVVTLGLRNAHHLGRIGTYGERCAQAGYVSLHFVNVTGHDPVVSPFAGREARLLTNPFCCAVPRDGERPVLLDMATSAIALGKVRVAYMKEEAVAGDALLDDDGRPTTEARYLYEEPKGSIRPFGLHKGYGLGLVCELLAGALAGERTIQPKHPRPNAIINHMLMIVLDPDLFGGSATFATEVEAMADYLRGTPAAEGHDRVRLPGDPEAESMERRLAQGIPIDDNSWADILAAAGRAGLSDDEIDALTSAGRAG
ncbi:MAG: malate/lactate/ureidoglycolate dehydrogenase [Gammaproteobacteria bacterium]|nr:malate/lactate/ureidoglycolate dehydrogenase [Gammaproteobacteria bacterium]